MKHSPALTLGVFCATVIFLVLTATAIAAGQQYGTLYSFKGGPDGAFPGANLIADKAGNLYGTTEAGGNGGCHGQLGCGTVFELSPPPAPGGKWTESVLHLFSPDVDGINPMGGLVLDAKGNLYGTAWGGAGVVFELSPPAAPGGSWTETVLYSFQGGLEDGENPTGALVLDSKGNLYGTTAMGGNNSCNSIGCGVVFQLAPPPVPGGDWTETILHTFAGPSE
jgi:hypothetical protein